MLKHLLLTMLIVVSAAAARAATTSTPPMREVLPVNDAGTITIVITGVKNALTLTTVCNVTVGAAAHAAGSGPPPGIAFKNKTAVPLRITLQQPEGSCKTACKTDMADYAQICRAMPAKASPDGVRTDEDQRKDGLCQPQRALEICGTPECNVIRAGCKGDGCDIDFYRAIESCGCSVTKTVPANSSTADLSEPPCPGTEIKRSVNQSPAPDVPAVLFEPPLFSTGLKPKSDDAVKTPANYRFAIYQDVDLTKPDAPARIYGTRILDWSVRAGGQELPRDAQGPNMNVVVVPLDDTGVASWRYLNPRNPACIACDRHGLPLGAGDLPPAGVVFRNRTFDRTFAVSITLPADSKVPDAYLSQFRCSAKKACTISRAVPPQTPILFDSSILSQFPRALITFDVSLLGEATQLSNSHAYLTWLPAFVEGKSDLEEPVSATQIKTQVSLVGNVDPNLPVVPDKPEDGFTPCGKQADVYKSSLEPVLCSSHPFTGGATQQYKANGTIQFSPNLGNRANGAVSLAFRSGTFGGTIDKTSVDQYYINVFGTNGLSLRFGKTNFAAPTGGIAVSEAGEGFLFNYRNYSLGHLISRESEAGTASQPNRDKKDWFLQGRSVSLNSQRRENLAQQQNKASPSGTAGEARSDPFKSLLLFFRTLDWVFVHGEDKNAESRYWTGGGEIFFARPGISGLSGTDGTKAVRNVVGWSLAAYRSQRTYRADAPCAQSNPPTCANGLGTVALLNLTWTPEIDIDPTTVKTTTTPQVFTVTYGRGTSNQPKKEELITDYVGENATFTFDKLLYAKFFPKMNATDRQYFPAGLANRQFLGVKYINNTVTLFDLIANALNVHDDVNTRSTTISLSGTLLRRPRNGSHEAGREADISFQIEVPKGVTFSLDAGYMEPGNAFSDLILKRAWLIAAGVSLSL